MKANVTTATDRRTLLFLWLIPMVFVVQPEYYCFIGGQSKDGVEHRARKLCGVPYGFMNGRREGVRGENSGSAEGISVF